MSYVWFTDRCLVVIVNPKTFFYSFRKSKDCTVEHPCVCAASYRLLVEMGCIKPLCDLLTLMDSKIVQVALNGIENILRLGELEAKRGGGINPYCALIEEAYGK